MTNIKSCSSIEIRQDMVLSAAALCSIYLSVIYLISYTLYLSDIIYTAQRQPADIAALDLHALCACVHIEVVV